MSFKILLLKFLQLLLGVTGILMLFFAFAGIERWDKSVWWVFVTTMQFGLGVWNLRQAFNAQKTIRIEEAVWVAYNCMMFVEKARAEGDYAKASEWLMKSRKATEYAERLLKEEDGE